MHGVDNRAGAANIPANLELGFHMHARLLPFVLGTLVLAAHVSIGQQPQRPGRPQQQGTRFRDTLRVGDIAPDFKLKTRDGDREVQLAAFKGKRPVVLVFGSYT
ncbi:MAG: redoxin domain-containing protein [Verrucomicrobia bacterium]|nr:redoxin domain-containing protein [Verrucomicrobiota bacterium]